MGRSTLERTGERQPDLTKGRTTRDLGPGDRSDSGSDVVGGPGLDNDDEMLGLNRGTTSDPDHQRGRETAGPDVGDENLDSDSDSGGSGERGAAGRDAAPPTDQQLNIIDEPALRAPPDDVNEPFESERVQKRKSRAKRKLPNKT